MPTPGQPRYRPGDRIAIDISNTNSALKGLPATITSVDEFGINYRYDDSAPIFAGVTGHVRWTNVPVGDRHPFGGRRAKS